MQKCFQHEELYLKTIICITVRLQVVGRHTLFLPTNRHQQLLSPMAIQRDEQQQNKQQQQEANNNNNTALAKQLMVLDVPQQQPNEAAEQQQFRIEKTAIINPMPADGPIQVEMPGTIAAAAAQPLQIHLSYNQVSIFWADIYFRVFPITHIALLL